MRISEKLMKMTHEKKAMCLFVEHKLRPSGFCCFAPWRLIDNKCLKHSYSNFSKNDHLMSLAVRIFKFFAFSVISFIVWNYGIGRFFEFEIVIDFPTSQRNFHTLKRQKSEAGKKLRNYYKIAKIDRNSTEITEIGQSSL